MPKKTAYIKAYADNAEELSQQIAEEKAMINDELKESFEDKLQTWNATLINGTTVRFSQEQELFAAGEALMTPNFKKILDEFCPRYIGLMQIRKSMVSAILIEGHTSSLWYGARSLKERYLENLELSQQRAYSVLKYCLQFAPEEMLPWLTESMRANGLAFAKMIQKDGEEDTQASKRVEIRLLLKSEDVLEELTGDIQLSLNKRAQDNEQAKSASN